MQNDKGEMIPFHRFCCLRSMQNCHNLQFNCQSCATPIYFSVFDAKMASQIFVCSDCGKKHAFNDELLKQLKQFEALCRQIHLSQEILGNTSIAIDVGSYHVKVPFNILLTRLSSTIELNIDGKKSLISFRIEPLKEHFSA